MMRPPLIRTDMSEPPFFEGVLCIRLPDGNRKQVLDHVEPTYAGRRACQSVARWNAAAARSTVASPDARPTSARPTGIPATKPHGTLATGAPASVHGELNGISASRYGIPSRCNAPVASRISGGATRRPRGATRAHRMVQHRSPAPGPPDAPG